MWAMIASELRAAFARALDPCSAVVRDCKSFGHQRELTLPVATRYKAAGEEDYDELSELPWFEVPPPPVAGEPRARSRRRHTTAEEFAKLAEDFGFKHCPQCKNACMKEDEDSCDHMTCICGKEFCWTCLADRDVILQHGNHYHKRDCRFFMSYDGPTEYITKCPVCTKSGKPCVPP